MEAGKIEHLDELIEKMESVKTSSEYSFAYLEKQISGMYPLHPEVLAELRKQLNPQI